MQKTEKKNNLFTSDDIWVVCPKNKKWKNMVEVINGRFCDGCHETLQDVTGYSKGEVMALQREFGKNICVGVSKKLFTSSLALSLFEQKRIQLVAKYDTSIVVGMPRFNKERVEQ